MADLAARIALLSTPGTDLLPACPTKHARIGNAVMDVYLLLRKQG